jgi:hypothetical protein
VNKFNPVAVIVCEKLGLRTNNIQAHIISLLAASDPQRGEISLFTVRKAFQNMHNCLCLNVLSLTFIFFYIS